MGWVVNTTPRQIYPRETDPVPIVQEAGWAPGPVWMNAENFAPTGIRSPDRPARSESLYRLSYPGPFPVLIVNKNPSNFVCYFIWLSNLVFHIKEGTHSEGIQE